MIPFSGCHAYVPVSMICVGREAPGHAYGYVSMAPGKRRCHGKVRATNARVAHTVKATTAETPARRASEGECRQDPRSRVGLVWHACATRAFGALADKRSVHHQEILSGEREGGRGRGDGPGQPARSENSGETGAGTGQDGPGRLARPEGRVKFCPRTAPEKQPDGSFPVGPDILESPPRDVPHRRPVPMPRRVRATTATVVGPGAAFGKLCGFFR